MKLNILGTQYTIHKNCDETLDPVLVKSDGYIDFSTKNIYIAKFEPSEGSMDDLNWYEQQVIRHEIVHAFMYESGLDINSDWGRDEMLIDWIAIQIPKMVTVMENLLD